MNMKEDFKEFRTRVCNIRGPHKHKVTGSLGSYDAYKYIRKNKWFNIGRPLTEHEFYSITRKINERLAEQLSYGEEVVFPCRMGSIEIRKYPKRVRYINGKLVTNLPVDWDRTLKLWYEDEEAYSKRTVVRLDSNDIYKVNYRRVNATYPNMAYIEFSCNWDIKRNLRKNIRSGLIDAFTFKNRITEYVDNL